MNVLTRFSNWTDTNRKLVWLIVFVMALAVLAIVLTPVFLIKRSVRAFERTIDGRRMEFFQKTDGFQLLDAETSSTWNFEGKATSGPLAGRELKKVFVLEDYWFDWRIYHPDTAVYDIGPR